MPPKQEVANWQVVAYSSYLAYVPFEGELVFFSGVITGQIGFPSVIGDGVLAIGSLPFADEVKVISSSNVDLEDFRVSGNRFKIYNSGSSTLEIEVGTTGSSLTYYLLPGREVHLFFDGSNWIYREENTIIMSDANLNLNSVVADLAGPLRVIMPSSGITANRTVTLITLADNQNVKIILENQNATYVMGIDGEGAETINTLTVGYLIREYQNVTVKANSNEWQIIDGSLFDNTDYQTNTNTGSSQSDGGVNYSMAEFTSSSVKYIIWGYLRGDNANASAERDYTLHRTISNQSRVMITESTIGAKNGSNPSDVFDTDVTNHFTELSGVQLNSTSSIKISVTNYNGNTSSVNRMVYTIIIETEL